MATAQGARAAAGGMGELMWDRDADGTHSVLPVGCAACALPRLGGVGNLSIPVRAASPGAAGPGLLPAGQQPPLLSSHPAGPQQLELVSILHGPPSACDLPAGRVRSASGTRRAASTPAQPKLLSAPFLTPQPLQAVLRAACPRAGVSLQVQMQWPCQ